MSDIGSGSVEDSIIKGKDWGSDSGSSNSKQGMKGNLGLRGHDPANNATLPSRAWPGADLDDKGSVDGDSGGAGAFGDDDSSVISSGGRSFGQK